MEGDGAGSRGCYSEWGVGGCARTGPTGNNNTTSSDFEGLKNVFTEGRISGIPFEVIDFSVNDFSINALSDDMP